MGWTHWRDCTLTVVSRYAAVRAGAQALGVRAVDSPESEKGLSYTIRSGLDALDLQDGDFIVFVVADQPYLTAETVARLLDAAEPGVRMVRVVFGERRGNPNLFCAALAPALRALEGDEGGRELLRGAGEDGKDSFVKDLEQKALAWWQGCPLPEK